MRTIDRTKVRVAGPVALPVSLDAAKHCLKVDGDDLDLGISAWIEGIVPQLEHEIGQCLMAQKWEVRQSDFTHQIPLPHPVISVDQVSYRDQDGVLRMLLPSDYELVGGRYASFLVPSSGRSWPASRSGANAVVVRVSCGYGADASSTPRNVQLYILARLVEQFDPVSQADKEGARSQFLDRLLDACRSH